MTPPFPGNAASRACCIKSSARIGQRSMQQQAAGLSVSQLCICRPLVVACCHHTKLFGTKDEDSSGLYGTDSLLASLWTVRVTLAGNHTSSELLFSKHWLLDWLHSGRPPESRVCSLFCCLHTAPWVLLITASFLMLTSCWHTLSTVERVWAARIKSYRRTSGKVCTLVLESDSWRRPNWDLALWCTRSCEEKCIKTAVLGE